MLTVYSKNNCSYCVKLKNRLDSWGIQYEEVNIEKDTNAKNFVVEQGHRTVPILYNGLEHINHNTLTKDQAQNL